MTHTARVTVVSSLTLALTLALSACAGTVAPERSASAPSTSPSPEVVDEGTNNLTVQHDPAVTDSNATATLESLRIPSSLTPAEKAAKLGDAFTRWAMAGATAETARINAKNLAEAVQPMNETLAAEIGDANTPVYAEAVWGPEWRDHQEQVNDYEVINENNIIRFLSTYSSEAQPAYGTPAKEAYNESWSENLVLDGWATGSEVSLPILEGDKNEARSVLGEEPFLILSFTTQRSNNASENGYDTDPSYAEDNGATLYWNVLLTSVEGNDIVRYLQMSPEPITDIDYRSITP